MEDFTIPLMTGQREEYTNPLTAQSSSSERRPAGPQVIIIPDMKDPPRADKASDPMTPAGDIYIKVSASAAASADNKCPNCDKCTCDREAQTAGAVSRPFFNSDLFAVVVAHVVSFWLLYLGSLVMDKVPYVLGGAVAYEVLAIAAAVNLLLAFANRDPFYAACYHHPLLVLGLWFIFALQWGAFSFCLYAVTGTQL